MKTAITALHFALLALLPGQLAAEAAFAPAFGHQVPLAGTGAGSFTVEGRLAGVPGEFLLDTGASMITISREYFAQIEGVGAARHLRQVAARMASGKLQALDVYLVEDFSLGEGCNLGAVEVAVLKSGGRNLLGMSALALAAPFAVSTAPPSLGLSNCGSRSGIAAR